MIQLQELNLTNVVLFKEAKLNLSRKGVTVIRGRNSNADDMSQSNGSGKSLLISSIPALLYGSNPIIQGSRATVRKDLFKESASVNLKLGIDESSYEIYKTQKGTKALKLGMTQNGTDLELRTNSIAELAISDLLNITEQEFYTFCYLDGRRPFTLHVGTSAQRLTFFTNLFRLNGYDHARHHFDSKIKEISGNKSLFENLHMKLENAESVYREYDEEGTKEEYSCLKSDLSEIAGEKEELSQTLERLHSYQVSVGTSFDQLDTIRSQGASVPWGDVDIKLLRQKVNQVNQELQDHYVYIAYQKDVLAQKKAKAKVSAEITTIKDQLGFEDNLSQKHVRKKLATLREQEQKVAQRKRQLGIEIRSTQKSMDIRNKGMAFIRKNLSDAPESIRDPGAYLAGELARVEAAGTEVQNLLKLLKGEESGHCPLCNSLLSQGQTSSILDEARARKDKLLQLRRILRKGTSIIGTGVSTVSLSTLRTTKEGLEEDLSNLEDNNVLQLDIRKLERLDALYAQWSSLKSSLVSNKGTKLDKPSQTEKYLKKISGHVTLYTTLQKIPKKLLREFGEMSRVATERKLTALRTELKELEAEHGQVSEAYWECSTLLRKIRDSKREITGYKRELAALKEEMRDLPVLKSLVEAFGPKGLKTLVMQDAANVIQDTMNKYSHLLFSEDFHFRFNIGKGVFALDVDRRIGSSTLTSDVRNLSGAEGRAFNLLLLLGVLPLMPSKRRMNCLFLDEMDANLSPATRNKFINGFLPALQTVIPHTVVATPQSDNYPGSKQLVVVKKGDQSVIRTLRT